MTNIARKFKIKHFKTTAYHPQSNGSVERSHHVIWEYLKQFTNKNDWDQYLAFAAFSYNTSVHEGTKYTPYQLIFGKLARTPTSNITFRETNNKSYTNYLTNLFYKISNTQEITQKKT
jgi:transposase InsO family protein